MKVKLLCVGKTNSSFIQSGIDDYSGRINRYMPFEIVCIPNIKNTKSLSNGEQNKLEGKQILANIDVSDLVILLDENGKTFSSRAFSDEINNYSISGKKQIVFVVGGAYGFSDEARKRANKQISLSKMTFSHQIIRLIFVEQYYRACTILRNEPYHHD